MLPDNFTLFPFYFTEKKKKTKTIRKEPPRSHPHPPTYLLLQPPALTPILVDKLSPPKATPSLVHCIALLCSNSKWLLQKFHPHPLCIIGFPSAGSFLWAPRYPTPSSILKSSPSLVLTATPAISKFCSLLLKDFYWKIPPKSCLYLFFPFLSSFCLFFERFLPKVVCICFSFFFPPFVSRTHSNYYF